MPTKLAEGAAKLHNQGRPRVARRVLQSLLMLRSARWLKIVVAAVMTLACSCVSPTLPLPPPSLPDISGSAMAGKVRLSSMHGAEANAIIVIYNRNPAVDRDKRVSGAQADGVGTWDADVVATPGDVLDVSQEVGNARSAPVTLRIPVGR